FELQCGAERQIAGCRISGIHLRLVFSERKVSGRSRLEGARWGRWSVDRLGDDLKFYCEFSMGVAMTDVNVPYPVRGHGSKRGEGFLFSPPHEPEEVRSRLRPRHQSVYSD